MDAHSQPSSFLSFLPSFVIRLRRHVDVAAAVAPRLYARLYSLVFARLDFVSLSLSAFISACLSLSVWLCLCGSSSRLVPSRIYICVCVGTYVRRSRALHPPLTATGCNKIILPRETLFVERDVVSQRQQRRRFSFNLRRALRISVSARRSPSLEDASCSST